MPEKSKKIFDYYSKYAEKNALISPDFQQEVLEFIISDLNQSEILNWKVLDFGCGLGANLYTLQKYFENIVAADINEYAISHLEKLSFYNRVHPVLLKDENLPFADESFDLVVCTEVLEHVSNLKQTLISIKRLIKKDGYLIISTPNYFNPTGIIKKIMDFKNKSTQWEPWGAHQGGFENFITFKTLNEHFKDFNILITMGADFGTAWLYPLILLRVKLSPRFNRRLGTLPILKNIAMHYYILARKTQLNAQT